MISIIIPVYNVELYLNKCIESVVKSTFANWEVILVDDGSTDSSGEICDAWAEKDSRIKVVHQQNNGVSSARNTGLKCCSGDYVAFIDADDYISEDMYEKLYQKITDTNSDIAVCGYYEENAETKQQKSFLPGKGIYEKSEAVKEYINNGGCHLTIWNKLFKKSICYNSNNQMILFPTDLTIGEDAVWLLNVTMNAKKVICIDEPKYIYIVNRADSAVTKSKRENKIPGCKSRLEASKRGYELLKKHNIDCCYLMYRRCVFSAKDIICAYYLLGNSEETKNWIDVFHTYLSSYKNMIGKHSDRMFILKNTLIYYSIKLHLPSGITKLLLNM
ncbi:MAG: glycosyltransferase [Oscillospiraceae bacterium]